MMDARPLLVAGATGYIGGRLVPRLLDAGWTVRAMGRSTAKLSCRPWAHREGLQIAAADILDAEALTRAVRGCRVAYYLIHSLGGPDFVHTDRRAAAAFAQACAAGGVERIIYLGGLGREGEPLSEHLRSRLDVGRTLAAGPVPVTFLRAGIVLGSGSASFEIIRYLAERLPFFVAGNWARTRTAPMAISDVLRCLVGCLEHPGATGQTYELCGPDVLSYEDLLRLYCQEARLPCRRFLHVPLVSPGLSARLASLLTPVPHALVRPLFEGLRNETLCRENRIRDLLPGPLVTVREAFRLALEKVAERQVETCWMDAGPLAPPEWALCGDAPWAGGTLYEYGFRVRVAAGPEAAFAPIQRIGGETGWYFGDALWGLRGIMDRMIGGVGLERGRRSDAALRVGDVLDFWRVIEIDAPRRLALLAEMKAPGEAVLQFDVEKTGENESEIRMIARFRPRGLAGFAYWYAVYPLHGYLFRGMMREIARASGGRITLAPEQLPPRAAGSCRLPGRAEDMASDQEPKPR